MAKKTESVLAPLSPTSPESISEQQFLQVLKSKGTLLVEKVSVSIFVDDVVSLTPESGKDYYVVYVDTKDGSIHVTQIYPLSDQSVEGSPMNFKRSLMWFVNNSRTKRCRALYTLPSKA